MRILCSVKPTPLSAHHTGELIVFRSTLPIAVTLTAATALLLTACGGSAAKKPDKISGADTSTPNATSAAPSASATEAGAPKFNLPSDVKVDFEGFESSNAAEQAPLRDASYAILAWTEGKANGLGNSTNMKRYFTGLQGAEMSDAIIKYGKSGMTVTGTYRDYRPTVRLVDRTTATVVFCEDQSKAYSKSRKTGKAEITTPSREDFSRWAMTLGKSRNGDWQVARYTYTQGVTECRAN